MEVIPVRLTAFAQGDCCWYVGLMQSVPKKLDVVQADLQNSTARLRKNNLVPKLMEADCFRYKKIINE